MPLSWLVTFVMLSFVVYRATRFIQLDTLFEEARLKLLAKIMGPPRFTSFDITSPVPIPPQQIPPALWRIKLYELLTCPYCFSAHVSWIAVLVAIQFISIPLPVFMWVAAAGGAMLVWRLVENE